MCGRFAIEPPLARFQLLPGINLDDVTPRYNVAPTDQIPIIRRAAKGGYEVVNVQWGLIPYWSEERKIQFSTINAKVERVQTAPAYREPFKKRRCLVPASGFYEWQKIGKGKRPWYISDADGLGIAFAGLWDRWRDPKTEEVIESCTVIVGPPNELLNPIHDRQPCILQPEHYEDWMSPDAPAEYLMTLLLPIPPDFLRAWPVSPAVGNVRNQGPDLIKPLPGE